MMRGKDTLNAAAPGPHARSTFTSLPLEVLQMIGNHLHGNDKVHLALCCTATLPILCMGHVRVRTSRQEREEALLQASRCLTRQPGGVSHLEVFPRDYGGGYLNAHHLIDLSLLSNLRKLTLGGVIFYLPALQPAATRLRELTLNNCRLQGSSDGFLTRSWTALTSLSLIHTEMQSATLTAALNLPALQEARLCWFSGHLGQELQLDQLAGSCPQVSRLVFDAGRSLAQASEADRQSCRLLNLSRLADLYIRDRALLTNVDLDLAPSLTQLRFGGECVDFFWALREAAKCSGRGAQLRRLTCECARAHLQPAQWGASLDEQHRRLGGQLGSLRELEVWGVQEQLLSAVGAIASAAPSLGRLVIIMKDPMPRVEVSPICSASLESIRVGWGFGHRPELPPPEVLLTLLPGCTRLGEVVVHFSGKPVEGAAVKIRCHGFSRRCIVPVDGYAHNYKRAPEEVNVDTVSIVRVRFLQRPPSEQGVQECTVLYGCHVAGPEEPPMWGHAVMPGIL